MCGGRRRIRSRSAAGVSPVRTQVRISTSGSPLRRELLPDAGQRRLEIAMDVVRQRLQRRHVDDLRRIGERRLETLAHQIVDRGEKGRERLARSRRRGDEGVAAGLDRGPRLGLRRRRRGETLGEPVRDRRVEQRFDAGRRSRRGPSFARAGSRVGVEARSECKRLGSPGTREEWRPPYIWRRIGIWSPFAPSLACRMRRVQPVSPSAEA